MFYEGESDSDQEEKQRRKEKGDEYRGTRPNQHALMKEIRKMAKEGQSLDINQREMLEKERER